MDDKKFFDTVRVSLFGGNFTQPQVDGLNVLLNEWAVLGDVDSRKLAYVLATAKHETADTMQPIAEYGHGHGHPYGAVDVSGKAPYGRGYVQLTWRYNYVRADTELKLGGRLAANYDLAMDPDIAAKIIVDGMMHGWFTGAGLGHYITSTGCDFFNARRIINGTDKAALIAGYANHFLDAIKGATT
jgi:hypothetical protein